MKYIRILFVIFIIILISIWIFNTKKVIKKIPQLAKKSQTNVYVHPTPTYTISVGATPDIPFTLDQHYTIHIFASSLGSPRDLQFSPGGTLLVSDSNNNRVYALPDKNHDGVADTNNVIISGEPHVHGLTFYNNKLFLADVDQVVKYSWDESTIQATKEKVLFSLPQNSDHNNRTIIFDNTGKMYVSVGSTCNVCYESSDLSATIVTSDENGTTPKIFAKGLRNAAFLAINPKTGELWATEMGRDYLGDDVPPDELNSIREGKNYGWPICFGNKIHDTHFDKNQYFRDPCIDTESSLLEIPAHSAPLGLTFINSSQFPQDWQGDLLVAYHGSWNRSTAIGYKVVHMKVQENTITNTTDFLSGFLRGTTKDSSLGRPVDMTFDSNGNLYVSDDKAGNIYIIQKK